MPLKPRKLENTDRGGCFSYKLHGLWGFLYLSHSDAIFKKQIGQILIVHQPQILLSSIFSHQK